MKPAFTQKCLAFLGDRTVIVIFLSALLIVALAAMRPQVTVNSGFQFTEFQEIKAKWKHCANVVAGGDSRITAAVCPQEMQKIMGDYEILNYGFRGTGFSDTYCQYLEDVLIPDAPQRMIILGITPLTLTEGASRVNGFTDYVLNTTDSKQKRSVMDEWLSPFAPLSTRDIRDIIFCREPNRRFTEQYRNGWGAIDIDRSDKSVGLRQYREQFSPELSGPVSPLVIQKLLTQVRRWKEKDIEVYGFRPPTCYEMERLENEIAQFDEKAIAEEFKAAGGIWLTFNEDVFNTSDGSHLLRESSMRLSKRLAEKICLIKKK